MTYESSQGCTLLGDGRARFRVWAPNAERVDVHLVAPADRLIPMAQDAQGYFEAVVDGVEAGARYFYRLDGDRERPDPASRSQPDGVHAASQVIALPAPFIGDWRGLPLADYVIYELHVGTFTEAGTFEAVIPHLDTLKAVGITAIEIMPIAQFPGDRGWGYDGVYLYAAQHSYGGADGLRLLVEACHARGMAVILDVVYNHLGPEGNYLWDYGPYFTDHYRTPWGSAVNLDAEHSDPVRRFLIDNVLYWIDNFGIDAFRLDAIQELHDRSGQHLLAQLAEEVHARADQVNRRIHVIAESIINAPRIIEAPERGGYGMDAQWADDFHHAVHVLLTGERDGYYRDYTGIDSLARALRDGFTYTGQYSEALQRRHGRPVRHVPAERFVVCVQNHDQVGNRRLGDRFSTLLDFESLKLAAGVLCTAPFIPMLFMGEEYAEPAPFPYFISHGDADLVEAVRKGRREEFAAFGWEGDIPDPYAVSTFVSARLNHGLRTQGKHAEIQALYTDLLRLRREVPALRHLDKDAQNVIPFEAQTSLILHRWHGDGHVFAAYNFGQTAAALLPPVPAGRWTRLQASQPDAVPAALDITGGALLELPPRSFALYALDSQVDG